ncbi:hypothetical protein KCW65_24675, partial [Mycobacterium tuberculosis]|nr:hypothetical protein [Mycobacterium tuberculosis]
AWIVAAGAEASRRQRLCPYDPAQVALWLAGNGHLDAVRDHVATNGGDLVEELGEYNLSTLLANAILAADPQFAASAKDVRAALRSQFPPDTR